MSSRYRVIQHNGTWHLVRQESENENDLVIIEIFESEIRAREALDEINRRDPGAAQ